ncbi:bifunctional 3,4-dihydroxy-2-butanone-4-phosphate synthase/GTP cyclohydrolase II [Leptospira gomenensis]|uniref:Riboflavin biosynthesis protein RibBA n=1 Tax=Leptospira gomenensis TaxID=2484974 RepID=A0A5F1Z0E7_9LEPT|nr:bifunctional 3,4-dihydroxy-2-butanone-4-phosphate synthase/GTP cyclohydrolase II [Leptospira gomenensis]TGK31044.1 bifunctional 3,4-dihydroxy-2-butanone-4-phosphate synthase/GTP cyclohydrolase II [Leptospira gomenensis]TGK43249.1 bifunctional 3,4-dihydroxy-2-butanone-4-phosphate synthase/GTP cyclohydrolase II [Leptospira gomenensis]TGK45236.1 bifunctional 3,4-dihydroxy-2-butanone-4-phosphate synthase/GTP cyclohydrolase II [Leptospira gomenensis]TGK66151.1 bifunctional 3,4-dihydroxy-2-butanon
MIQPIENAIEEIKSGRMIILVDSEDRENEGDLVVAAEFADKEKINFMATFGRGLICMPMEAERLKKLGLHRMVDDYSLGDKHGTAFTVSVDAKQGTSTGISAQDRAVTVQVLLDEKTVSGDLMRPGHLFPLQAVPGGVLRRAGHTEASVDLSKLAGLYAAGVICEIMNDDGTMARLPDLEKFAEKHGLNIYTIEDLIRYRRAKENLIRLEVESKLPTEYGDFAIRAYSTLIDDKIHVALVKGEIKKDEPVMVRVHSECLTGDIFSSNRCDCGPQLHSALEMISKEGKGVLLYMRQEGRGIGLINKLKAYNIQDKGYDTVEANEKLGFAPDLRDYGIGAQILREIGVGKMKILTNNPRKIVGLDGYGLEVVERIPIEIQPGSDNHGYLMTKKLKLGHILGLS